MKELINETVHILSRQFSDKIQEILSNCDSPIESVMLIYLVKEFLIRNGTELKFNIDNDIPTADDSLFGETKFTKLRRKKFQFQHTDNFGINYRYCAFEISPLTSFIGELMANGSVKHKYNQPISEEIIIEPQHFFNKDSDNYFFIDIAIYKKVYLKKDKKHILVNKIAVECDGHDFHSSKEQIKSDNKRARILTKNGWSVLRYSGSEIYQESKRELREIMSEVIQIFEKDDKKFL